MERRTRIIIAVLCIAITISELAQLYTVIKFNTRVTQLEKYAVEYSDYVHTNKSLAEATVKYNEEVMAYNNELNTNDSLDQKEKILLQP